MSLREHLLAIYEAHGELTPDIVVAAARPKDHPLHYRVFDRAPREAAEAWYRHQARDLIQSVKVVYREADGSGRDKRVRAFVAVQQSETPSVFRFEPVEKVAGDPFLRKLALQNMEREWKQLYARYGDFEEFAALVTASIGEQAA